MQLILNEFIKIQRYLSGKVICQKNKTKQNKTNSGLQFICKMKNEKVPQLPLSRKI